MKFFAIAIAILILSGCSFHAESCADTWKKANYCLSHGMKMKFAYTTITHLEYSVCSGTADHWDYEQLYADPECHLKQIQVKK